MGGGQCGAAGPGLDDSEAFLEDLMKQLVSKECMYDPMKQISTKYLVSGSCGAMSCLGTRSDANVRVRAGVSRWKPGEIKSRG